MSLRFGSFAEESETEMSEKVELADLVDYVAEQLVEAENRASKRANHVLVLQECELEMSVTVSKDSQLGLRVYVVQLGGRRSDKSLHRVAVKLRADGDHHVFETGADEGDGWSSTYSDESTPENAPKVADGA